MKRAVIFTAKSTETIAVKDQLLGPIGNPRTAQTYVYEVYQLKRDIGGDAVVPNVEVALYETGRGQDEVLPAVPPIVRDFDPHLALYVGCAGGDPNEINVYDVFIPTDAWPYEKGKETEAGFESRAHPLKPTRYLYDRAMATAIRPKWRARIPKGFLVDFEGNPIVSQVKPAPVASGNKVLTDDEGEIWKTAKSISDEIIAVETECFAFFKAMEPLHRPHLMIRGISDVLKNKNKHGKALDDDRQTRATAHAGALAAQLILDADDGPLRRTRGAELPPSIGKLVGFWKCEWGYGTEKCQELLHIERVDAMGHISGRRVSKMPNYEYIYDVSGTFYGERIHLTAIPLGQSVSISVSLVLKAVGNFHETLTGIAIRPLGNPPIPDLGPKVLTYGEELWASIVEYKKLDNPALEAKDLWESYERDR